MEGKAPATIQESSDNIFRDLGFEPEEALNLKVRSDLMLEISKRIEERVFEVVEHPGQSRRDVFLVLADLGQGGLSRLGEEAAKVHHHPREAQKLEARKKKEVTRCRCMPNPKHRVTIGDPASSPKP